MELGQEPFERPEKRRSTRFTDWFQSNKSLRNQTPFALATPAFIDIHVVSDDGRKATLLFPEFKKLVEDRQPKVWARDVLDRNFQLGQVLHRVWERVPRYVLLVPVVQAASTSLAILGRKAQPKANYLSDLVDSLKERSEEQLAASVAEAEEIQQWNQNKAPTIVIDAHGRPVLFSKEACRFFQVYKIHHLEEVLTRKTCEDLHLNRRRILHDGQLQTDCRIELDSIGRWKAQLLATVIENHIALVLAGAEKLGEAKRRRGPGGETLTRGLAERRSTRFFEKRGVLCRVHCDPMPPLFVRKKFELSIGRDPDNELVLPHPAVSRKHAILKVRGQSVTIYDNRSANGLFVNGQRRASYTLSIGDRFQIGPYELDVRAANDPRKKPHESTVHGHYAITDQGSALSGELSQTPLVEVLQGLEFHQKTGTLVIVINQQEAYFTVLQGAAHSAQFGRKRDHEAVMDMLQLTDGHFSFLNREPKGDRRMKSTITSILLEASRQIDEGPLNKTDTNGPAAHS